jgi:hypothetical protein
MISHEPLASLAVSAPYDTSPAAALDADFNARWDAWVVRGRVHEQLVRRKILVVAAVLALAAAAVYALFR